MAFVGSFLFCSCLMDRGLYECVCMFQRSKSDACEEQIQDEVQRQVKKCVCPKQYHMHKLTDGQYRVSRFYYFVLL